MARIFSVLSGSTPTTLVTDYFDSRNISNGISKRSGLIASRSAVSTDIYSELDLVNQDGGKGIYFPPDLLQTVGSLLSGSAYTSSVDGIRIPTTNTYGTGTINYSKRPTASIVSTDTTLVTPTVPLDSADVINNVYLSASNAVKIVLDSITDGGPYGRPGNNPSRTLHSIWHDPDLGYFAWDDFTPGAPPTPTITNLDAGASGITAILETNLDEAPFANDNNPTAPLAFFMSLAPAGGSPGTCTRQLVIPSGSVFQGTATSSVGPSNCSGGGDSSWQWDGVSVLQWTINVGSGQHQYEGRYTLHDPIIQTHETTSIQPTVIYPVI